MLFSLVLSVLLTLSAAQSCRNAAGTGPCINGNCAVASDKCITATGICCAAADYVAAPCCDKVNPTTKINECPSRKAYCNNAAYKQLMTVECPKTCGFCGNTPNPTCVDKVNPTTNINECPSRKAYCTNAAYKNLMTTECPKTCGFC